MNQLTQNAIKNAIKNGYGLINPQSWLEDAQKLGFRLPESAYLLRKFTTQLSQMEKRITALLSKRKMFKVHASKMFALADPAGDDLVFTAANPGKGGNLITLTFVDPGAPNQALSVSVVGKDITVNLGTDGGSVLNSTLQEIKDAINNNPDAKLLGRAELLSGILGTAVNNAAIAQTNLEKGELFVSLCRK